ncbi:MAG: hypothetical protein CMJ41_09875 [Phycisphaerae bacterium]|nr:hypothetical protein [Phycisphaerae bacterium]HBZ97242.1 hypothetical protein [Phycisphaerales bacterium]
MNMPMSPTRFHLITLTTVLASAAPAVAQNALGDGHALDGNISTRGRENTETGRVRAEQNRFSLSQRAADGRGFNQSIGFRSNEDFRRANSEMSFYADSLYNNPWYWENLGNLTTELVGSGGSGGMGAVAANNGGGYYNPFFYNSKADNPGRFAMGRGLGNYGLGGSNEFGGVRARDVSKTDYVDLETDDRNRPVTYGIGTPNRFLRDNRRSNLLRNEYELRDINTQPDYVGIGRSSADVPVRYSATTLQGIAPLPYPTSHVEMGLTEYDLARVQEDQRLGRGMNNIGAAWRPNFDALSQIDDRISNEADGTRIDNRDYRTMDQLLMEIADRYDEVRQQDGVSDPGALTMLQNDYQNVLKEVMDGYGLQEAPAGLDPTNLAGTGEDDVLPDTPPRPTIPGAETTPEVEEPSLMPLEEFGQILRHGQKVEMLSSDDKTRISELILGAQDKLSTGEYYWAERRFNRALRFEPGNPLATAGLAHAQLGGGLYLTSALTLQSLLGFQPEMIDVVYSKTLLPLPEDLERAVRELNRRITSEADSDRYAFLLAYIGHQTDNPAMIEQGLREMRRVRGDEAFLELLEQIWLPERKPVEEAVEIIPLEPVEDPSEPVGSSLLDE